MRTFLLRRLLFAVISFFGATLLMFGLSLAAHDPRELMIPDQGYGITEEQWLALERAYGLDASPPVRYFRWISGVLQGDFGKSISKPETVTELLMGKIGATMQIALGGWMFAMAIGLPVGVLAAVKRGKIIDIAARGFALGGLAIPNFWVGIMLILLFAVQLQWLPSGTRPVDFSFKHYIMPSITLGWPAAAGLMRLTRSSMLEIMDSEYVVLARAKGVTNNWVIWKHAFRNSLVVPLTSIVFLLAGLMNGAIIVESVFGWPGIGLMASSQAVLSNDLPIMMGAVTMFVAFYLIAALLADLLYAVIDPRIRYN
jgi:peptide/nickel transport system permease protein